MDLTETVAKIVGQVTQSIEAELRAEMKSKISNIEIKPEDIESVIQSELRSKVKNLMSGSELVKLVTDQASVATELVAEKIATEELWLLMSCPRSCKNLLSLPQVFHIPVLTLLTLNSMVIRSVMVSFQDLTALVFRMLLQIAD